MDLVILPPPTPTPSCWLQCFLPQILWLLRDSLLLMAFEAQYYTEVRFQQNACVLSDNQGLSGGSEPGCVKGCPTGKQELQGSLPWGWGAPNQGCSLAACLGVTEQETAPEDGQPGSTGSRGIRRGRKGGRVWRGGASGILTVNSGRPAGGLVP